ncbi:MAG: acyltransferase family protein [Lachnospiraceae bacterium]|nr:acyltransferase family protein [Lachnospiraceae bacterium]
METAQMKRQAWIDYFKAITIILVVIGHATGKFNIYIYQFHVAAFFFISGWVAKLDEENIIDALVKRICSLIVPLFTMVLLCGIFTKLCFLLKIDKYIFDDSYSISFVQLCENFWRNGTVVSLLGASWFVVVLFFTTLFSHVLYKILQGNTFAYLILTILIYLYGYYRMKNGANSLIYGVDLMYVAQGYYGVAYTIKKKLFDFNYNRKSTIFNIVALLFSTSILMLLARYTNGRQLMDLATRRIEDICWSTLAVTNGIVWLMSLSKVLSQIQIKFLNKLMSSLGQNTLGIMFLHFGAFRIVTLILCLMGQASKEELMNLIPMGKVSDDWWLLYTVLSICISWIVWVVLKRIPVLSSALGKDKTLLNSICNTRIYNDIKGAYLKVFEAISKGINEFKDLETLNMKQNVINIIILIFCASCCIGCKFIPSIQNNNVDEQVVMEGPVEIEFPYNGEDIIFETGWLPQSDGENYRWVEQNSVFKSYLSNQTKIILNGYVPEDIEGMNSVKLFLNGELVTEKSIFSGDVVFIEEDITDYILIGENTFEIVFDSTRVPSEEDLDKRTFSAMFNSIVIE